MEDPFKTNFFQNELQTVLQKLVLVTDLLIILAGFTALQTSELFKNQQNQFMFPYFKAVVINITFRASQAPGEGRGAQSQLTAPSHSTHTPLHPGGGPRVWYLHDTNLNIPSAQTPRG